MACQSSSLGMVNLLKKLKIRDNCESLSYSLRKLFILVENKCLFFKKIRDRIKDVPIRIIFVLYHNVGLSLPAVKSSQK